MTSLTGRGLPLAALLAASLLGPAIAHSQTPAKPAFRVEADKQSAIYNSRGQARPDGYVIDRTLLSYGQTLPAGFHKALGALGPEDRWLDIGAGEGRAVLDYCTAKYDVLQGSHPSGRKARAVAMSIEDRRTPQWYETAASLEDKQQISYLYGKSLREYTKEELGQFQVISDVIGGFSYAQNLSIFMEKTLSFLKTGGTFYTVLQDVESETGNNTPYYADKPGYAGATFLTEIKKADGSNMKLCSWLKSIGCVQVTCDFKANFTPPIEVYAVHKVCDQVSVPALALTHFEAGTPPERKYRLADTPRPGTAATR